MKKKILGIFFSVVMSVLFGFVSAKLVYGVYEENINNSLSSSKIFLVENGSYLTYENMREENSGNNYVYYKDDEGYKTVVGITRDEENIKKIQSLYNDNLEVQEYYIPSDLLDDKQIEYDFLLSNTKNMYEVREVVDNILNLYRENDTIKIVLAR